MRLIHRNGFPGLALGIVACLSLGGTAIVVYATAIGPSAGSDSVAYIVSAQNLLTGSGLGMVMASGDFSPLYPHFPPAYSLVLATGGLLTRDLVTVARWTDILAFGLLIAIVGVAPILLTGKPGIGIALSIVALSSTTLVRQFTAAMSEPLFILTSTLGIFLVAAHLLTTRRAYLAGAALALGLASATRYIGVSFIAAGGLAIVVLGQEGWSRRFGRALAFSLAALLPMLLWFLVINAGGALYAPRELAQSASSLWASLSEFRRGVVISSWAFSPLLGSASGSYDSRKMLLLAIAASWLLLLTLGLRHMKGDDPRYGVERRSLILLTVVPAFFAAAHLLTLGLAFVFSRPQPDINARMLSPIILPVWISAITVWLLLAERYPGLSILRFVPYSLVAFTAFASFPSFSEHVEGMHTQGSGYTSRAWRTSAAILAARSLPGDSALISNDSAALMFLAGHAAYDIPELERREERDVFLMFGEDRLDPIERIFREEGAALVLFSSARGQFMGLYGDRADARIEALTGGLEIYADTPDGTIYIYPR